MGACVAHHLGVIGIRYTHGLKLRQLLYNNKEPLIMKGENCVSPVIRIKINDAAKLTISDMYNR